MIPAPEREPSSKPFLYIIDGYGNFGHKRKDVLQNRCLATISRNPSQGADFNSHKEIPKNLVEQAQGVVVTIPDPAKFENVSFWLEQRKNVIVEKPFLASPEQLLYLQKIACENKVVWHTAYNHRNETNIKRIKELLEKGFPGRIYHAKLCYGYGNAQQLTNTWRDHNLGVLADLGSHLIDLTHYFFGYDGKDFEGLSLRRVEWHSGIDYSQFRTRDEIVVCEASMLHWKNAFEIDIFGHNGSLHLSGLPKWGGSTLTIRKRVFPSGVPEEYIIAENSTHDTTLAEDFIIFENNCKTGQTSYADDLRVITALDSITSHE